MNLHLRHYRLIVNWKKNMGVTRGNLTPWHVSSPKIWLDQELRDTFFLFNTGWTGFVTHFSRHISSIYCHLSHKNSAYYSPNLINLYLNFLVSQGGTLPRDTFQVWKYGKIRSSVTDFVYNTGPTGFVTHFSWHIFSISCQLWHKNSAYFSPNLRNLYLPIYTLQYEQRPIFFEQKLWILRIFK